MASLLQVSRISFHFTTRLFQLSLQSNYLDLTMKLNKSKNKGKVHPSPSSSSSSSQPDPVSTLKNLLPTAILTLISVLSPEDKQVLAYMITLSSSSSSSSVDNICQKGKRTASTHKIPSYECGCFDCYTTYWFRWDSSPNRQLIHQAIEAFEEHLFHSQLPKTTPKSSSRRDNKVNIVDPKSSPADDVESITTVVDKVAEEESPAEDDVAVEESGGAQKEYKKLVQQQQQQQQQQHKWLASKVLPDVIGLFNSRLWNLWGPNV